MDNWKVWLETLEKKPYSALGLIILFALPVTLILVHKTQDFRSRAAAPNQLEAEGGVLNGNAVIKQDTNASGGSYVALGTNITPTPTPTQTVGIRLTPSTPTGSNVYTVPASVDKTGATDVATALQNWINTVPSGTSTTPNILVFPSGAIYKISQGMRFDGKNYLTFWGYGSTIHITGPGNLTTSSAFYMLSVNNIKILGFTIKGDNSDAGTANAYHSGVEYSMGILGYQGTNDIEIADNHITNTYGDGVYLDNFDSTQTTDRWNIHNNLIELTGRQGIVPDEGQDIYIEYNILRNISGSVVDAEDQRNADQYLRRVYIRNNLFDRWAWAGTPTSYYSCHALPMDYSAGQLASMSDIYIENNTFQGGCMGPGNLFAQSNTDGDVSMWGNMPKTNIYVRNNTFNLPSNQQSGWEIRLNTVTGGQVTGNSMPGQTVQCSSCSNVTTSPNP